ncbi:MULTISPECIES: hypothetical protein [unclassified Halomonas]|uniref:hypothetical protein n=1 Tax=unclassified Halomonas TaxID=2609666 RepID=UPI0005548C25|nr:MULTISPECIES: hypothetical protein [unclassified Halomonas]CEP33697.1 Type I restriction enzyme EcoKI R protein [Halomonas sp. R57-5]
MDGIKLARELTIWFHSSFGKAGTAFNPGPFVPPGTKPVGKKEHADYVLFIGLTPIAVVEAKKRTST